MTRAAPIVLLASLLMACGGAPVTTGTAAENRSIDTASAAAKAAEPRTADPTAARPTTPSERPTPPLAPVGAGSALPKGPGAPPPPSSEPMASEPAAPPAAPTAPPPKRIGARHVLIQWMGAQNAGSSVVRSREQALALAEDVLRRARAKEDFARLAVEYSDEPNAGQRGGSLGRFGHGQMVPAFEEAAFKLQVGEISGIVESPFGFHVIQRTE